MGMRELRSGAGGLAVFVLCIALGVASVAAIGSLSAAFDEALARQGRLLIGGDLSFELIHRQANAAERAALQSFGQLSELAGFRAMARSPAGKSALVEVKAVDDAYPLYGDVAIADSDKTGQPWREPRGRPGRAHAARPARPCRSGARLRSARPPSPSAASSANSRTGSPTGSLTDRSCSCRARRWRRRAWCSPAASSAGPTG